MAIFYRAVLLIGLLFPLASAYAQGGPPYYTTDPGTPGNLNWEINVAYMPFLYSSQSVSHLPDLDINFGLGDRFQMTYENAWLRVKNPGSSAKMGLGQSNAGVKWRFYDAGENGPAFSVFPQVFVNNPDNAVRRGITPHTDSLLLPVEFAKKVGPLAVNCESGFLAVHKGANGYIAGVVVGHEFSSRLEVDGELYSQGTFHPSVSQPVLDAGARYKLRDSVILLLMAGRGVETAHDQPSFVGYFGVQFLLSSKRRP